MTTLQLFNYGTQEVRTVIIDGEPGFIANDLCAVLDIRNPRDTVAGLDDDEKGVATTDTPGGSQQMAYVTEAGMYSLVLRSRKPEAKAFKRWLTHEVLPAIRKTGTYSTAPALPQSYSEALRELAANVEAKELAEARAKELEIPASAWGVMVAAHGDYAVDEAAKILSRDADIEIGRNRLFDYMADHGWTYRQGARNSWHAYQSQVDNGRVVLRMSAAFLNAKTGEMENPAPTLRITAKGIDALRIALLKREI
nr:phage antirepressor KilAC domain-containing protein [Actinomycetota bacterium]